LCQLLPELKCQILSKRQGPPRGPCFLLYIGRQNDRKSQFARRFCRCNSRACRFERRACWFETGFCRCKNHACWLQLRRGGASGVVVVQSAPGWCILHGGGASAACCGSVLDANAWFLGVKPCGRGVVVRVVTGDKRLRAAQLRACRAGRGHAAPMVMPSHALHQSRCSRASERVGVSCLQIKGNKT
jgi:hypothetical protein